jgi:RecB family exonuclease
VTERQIHVSNSEITTFKRCRRKWWLSYYRKLRPVEEKVYGPLALGTRVHDALAVLYSFTPGDPVQRIRDLYEEARDSVDPEDSITTENLNSEAELALRMIEGYIQWLAESGVDDDFELIGVEEELQVPFDSLPVILIGKLDTRIKRRSDGRVFSMDHKTCATFDSITKMANIQEQPKMYALLERLTNPNGDHVTGGVYNMLRKVKRSATAKPPFYARESVVFNEIEMRNFYKRIYGELHEMLIMERRLDAGEDHQVVAYPTPRNECSWDCDFKHVCPMFDDGSRAEAFIEVNYKVHNPYERYLLSETSV